jgi:hypothetical protein
MQANTKLGDQEAEKCRQRTRRTYAKTTKDQSNYLNVFHGFGWLGGRNNRLNCNWVFCWNRARRWRQDRLSHYRNLRENRKLTQENDKGWWR